MQNNIITQPASTIEAFKVNFSHDPPNHHQSKQSATIGKKQNLDEKMDPGSTEAPKLAKSKKMVHDCFLSSHFDERDLIELI